ncbi:MAG: hypothetical protein MJE77_11585 [Proteobacteria bacterium]|nr:hypothetical protein [Pseudomonadota bacterium]
MFGLAVLSVTLMGGRSVGGVWAGIAIISMILRHITSQYGVMTAQLLSPAQLREAHLVEVIGIVVFTYMAVWNYERTKETMRRTLVDTQRRLVDAARRAGMAEVATGVLHNVGNVLNSVGISVEATRDLTRSRALYGIKQGVALLCQQKDLAHFFAEDPRGPKLVQFLQTSARILDSERTQMREELERLSDKTTHIKLG